MISAPLPSISCLPKEICTPRAVNSPGEEPGRWIPVKGGRSSSMSWEVPAAPSLPRVGKGDLGRTKKAKRVWKELPHSPALAGKGKCQQGGHRGGDGAAGTRGERVRKTATGSRRARLGYGEGSSLHPAQKKNNSKTPPNPTPDTLNTSQHFPVGDGKAAMSFKECFLLKTSL